MPAERVATLIKQTGGKIVTNVRLFDVYRDEKIGAGKKSLAYSLTYQSDKTMTDAEAAAIRTKIVKRLEYEVGAKLQKLDKATLEEKIMQNRNIADYCYSRYHAGLRLCQLV